MKDNRIVRSGTEEIAIILNTSKNTENVKRNVKQKKNSELQSETMPVRTSVKRQ
jgi:hypothetical protein